MKLKYGTQIWIMANNNPEQRDRRPVYDRLYRWISENSDRFPCNTYQISGIYTKQKGGLAIYSIVSVGDIIEGLGLEDFMYLLANNNGAPGYYVLGSSEYSSYLPGAAGFPKSRYSHEV